MACFHPLDCWQVGIPDERGKRAIYFKEPLSINEPVSAITVPCGRCSGCRLERSRQWAIRCSHEASLNDDNCFITLTYKNEHLPPYGSLQKAHFQKFIKRLRKANSGRKIRYYHCGEYGEKLNRPHYHACIFNYDFPDKKIFKQTHDVTLYTSELLAGLWPYGYSTTGDVTFKSAAYVARYVMKKINGTQMEEHYSVVDDKTGEIIMIQPEYTTMSLKPGIGAGWYKKWRDDVYPSDEVIIEGRKSKPPRFYDNMFEHDEPEEFNKIKMRREEIAEDHADDNTPERLAVREKVHTAQMRNLKRELETNDDN